MSNKHIRNALIIAQNARKHFDGGGPVPSDSSLMDKIFGGTDYVSSGGGSQGNYSQPVVTDNKVNWGNPDSSSDFFKADKAYQDLYGGNTNATSPFYTQRPSQSQSPSLIDRILGKTPASTASPAPASNSTSTPVPPTNVQNVNVPNLGNIKDISDQSTYPNAGKPLNSVDGFVFHHSAGGRNAQDVLDTLNARHLGVQYVIDRDGTIYRTLPDGSRGAHILPSSINNLSNMNTIGAEVVAKDNNDVTPAQIASGQKLFGVYKQQYPKLTAWGHGELNPNHKMADEGMAIVSAIRKGVANPTFQSSPTNLPPIQNRTFINYGTGNFARGGYATDGTVDEGVAANPALKTMDVSPNTAPTKDMTTIGAPPPASISPTTTRTPSIPNAMTSPVNVGIPNTTTAPVTGKTDSPYLSNPMANGGKSDNSDEEIKKALHLARGGYQDGGPPTDQDQPSDNTSTQASILPLSKDTEGNIHFDPHAGILGSVIDAFTLPHDVMSGNVDPMSDEGIKRATNFALTTMGGGAGGAEAKEGETVLGSGPIRKALDTVKEMPERQLNDVGLYSNGAEVANQLPQAKGKADDLINMLRNKGVKPAELENAGLTDSEGNIDPYWSGKTITKDELANHLQIHLW